MTWPETVAVFVGIPLAVYLLLLVLVYSRAGHHSARYRPGRPFEFSPVWFVSSVDSAAPDGARGALLTRSLARGQLTAGDGSAERPLERPLERAVAGGKGGARGTW